MGVIRRAYNFVMGLIGLIVLAGIIFLFVAVKWQEHKDQKQAEERDELIEAVAQESRERGLGDLEQLRQEYLAACPTSELLVLEGDLTEICGAMAEVLLEQSEKRQMTLDDHIELQYRLCALEARQEGEDPEDYCYHDKEYATSDILGDALAAALCDFDRAWVFNTGYESHYSKRGPDVYYDHELRVECATGQFDDPWYEGFFDGIPEEEEEDYPPIFDQWYEALEAEDLADARQLLDAHDFGKDEDFDHWVLGMLLEDRLIELLQEALDRNGGRVNYDTHYYEQPLSMAIDGENPNTALLLLEAGADPLRPDSDGMPPVVAAAQNGMLSVVQALVARGADVDGVKGSESLIFGAALEWAAWKGHEETALWLLEQGAEIEPQDPAEYPMWSDDSLLEAAAYGGSLPIVERVIDKGATNDDTPRLLQTAVQGGNADVLQLLFEQGHEMPEADYHDRLYDAVTDIIKGEGKGSVDHGVRMFEMLLERGLDMSEVQESGWHYGHQAVIFYGPSTVPAKDGGQRAALERAQRIRFVKRVVDEVLAAGVDIDLRYESETMLMNAADNGQPELVRHLLDHGADVTLRNDKGQSALDKAASEGRRLTSYWEENELLRSRFAETVEILGGTREMLDPVEEPDPGS